MGGRCCHPCLENVYLHSQSSMETNVIRSWLGHVSFTTTNEYIEIDMAMKREALDVEQIVARQALTSVSVP